MSGRDWEAERQREHEQAEWMRDGLEATKRDIEAMDRRMQQREAEARRMLPDHLDVLDGDWGRAIWQYVPRYVERGDDDELIEDKVSRWHREGQPWRQPPPLPVRRAALAYARALRGGEPGPRRGGAPVTGDRLTFDRVVDEAAKLWPADGPAPLAEAVASAGGWTDRYQRDITRPYGGWLAVIEAAKARRR